MSYAPHSFLSNAALSAYRVVAVSAAQTVGYPADSAVLPIGITADMCSATGTSIPVYGPGQIAKLYFNDSCAAGALVAADSSGRGVLFTLQSTTTSSTLSAAYIGVHLGAKVEDTGTLSDVFILPGYEAGA